VAVITFSREARSGTQDLARLLAQRLGYRYVSRDELTAAVTARGGVQRVPQTSESEGRALSRWEQFGEQLTGDRATYVAALKAVITDLAVADNVVIVGHGAGQFLGDVRGVVRIFVVAPIEDRLRRLADEGVVDVDLGRRLLEQQDRESAAYVRYLFGIDWLDPHAWDLVINTGRANIAAVLEMLAQYTTALIRDQAEQDGLARQQLAAQIEQALLADPELGVAELSVRVTEPGTIVLDGHALAHEDRERAERTARARAPDTAIDNHIVVHPPTSA